MGELASVQLTTDLDIANRVASKMNDDAVRANGLEERRTSRRLSLHRGFTPISSSSARPRAYQADDTPPRVEQSTREKPNAAVKLVPGTREIILQPSHILTQTDTEWLQGDLKYPSTNSKKRTNSQGLIHSASSDAFTDLRRVKLGSPCFSFNPHATSPPKSNRSPSPYTILNNSKDDAPAGLSTATVNNFCFIYQPVETRTSIGTNENNAEATAGVEELSAPCSGASEARPEMRSESYQHLLELDLRTRNLGSVSNQRLSAYTLRQSDLGEEVNGGVDFSDFNTSDLHAEVWNAFKADGTTPAVESASNFLKYADARDVPCREDTDGALLRYQHKDLGHDQIVGDSGTDYDDYAWDTSPNKALHSIKFDVYTNAAPVSTSGTSILHQVDEFDADSDDDEFIALYEALQSPVDGHAYIHASTFPQRPPESDRRTEERISDTQIGGEDWNALHGIHTSELTADLPEPVGVFEELEIMDSVRRDSKYLLSPMDDPADSDFASKTQPAKFFKSEENDFDGQVNEEDLLQAEAQMLQSEEFNITDDEFDVDESVLLQAERDMLVSAAEAGMRERNRVSARRALPPPKSNTRRNEISCPKSLERRPATYQLRQEPFRDQPVKPAISSPVSIIAISSTSPIRRTPTPAPQSAHEIPPFVRSPFPKAVTTRCPIYGVSNKSMLRVCFRIAEVFKAASSQRSSDTTTNVEFYAAVTHSSRCADMQTFNFADLFFPARPPFLTGSYQGWKGSPLYEHDTGSLLDVSPTRLRMCRAVGTLTRTVAGQLAVKILNIWEASWEDISWVRGIVDP